MLKGAGEMTSVARNSGRDDQKVLEKGTNTRG